MPISISGSGTITGISAGGLPDDSIVTADIANGAVTQAKRSEQLTLATAQSSTSGTNIDFTGIPSWVKRVTVILNGVSTNGASNPLIQVGTSTGFNTTGYTAASNESATKGTYSTGFGIMSAGAANVIYGHVLLTNINSNNWLSTHTLLFIQSGVYYTVVGFGSISLSAVLDRIRITTVSGTDAFDAGTINILYE